LETYKDLGRKSQTINKSCDTISGTYFLGDVMRIVSDDAKLLERVLADLEDMGINDITPEHKTPIQGSQLTCVEFVGLAFGIPSAIVGFVSYLKTLEKDGYLVCLEKAKVKEITLGELNEMDEATQREMLNDYEVVLKP